MKTLCPHVLGALGFAGLLLAASFTFSDSGQASLHLAAERTAGGSNCVLVTPQPPGLVAAVLCR
jgi:hypothetical protein